MIESTTYNENNPIKVIVHGWLGTTQEKDGVCSYNVKCKFKHFFSNSGWKNIIFDFFLMLINE